VLMKGRYVAIDVPFDSHKVAAQINQIGFNVNQIARKCNEDDLVTATAILSGKARAREVPSPARRRLKSDA
jgi:hypothetical protein